MSSLKFIAKLKKLITVFPEPLSLYFFSWEKKKIKVVTL
jgi:hypothetical protein